jgi:hypothetical protein
MNDLHLTLPIFVYSAGASLCLDLLTLAQDIRRQDLPARYRSPFFWVIRILVAFISGGIALYLGLRTPLQAFFVGLSAPLLLQRLAKDTSAPLQRM